MFRLTLSVVLAVGMLFISAPVQADEAASEPAETAVTATKAEQPEAPAAEEVEPKAAPTPEAAPEVAPAVTPEPAPSAPAAKKSDAAQLVAEADEPEPKTPGELCSTNYFKTQKMWEISWGRQYSDTNGTTTFTMASNGGMKFLNDQPLPSYFTNNFRWLYVNDPVQTYQVKYGFADGTVRYAKVSPDSQGCPSVEWTTLAPVPNSIETSHVTQCVDGVPTIVISLRNRSPWIYPVSYSTDGSTPNANGPTYGPVVDNRTNGGLNGPQKDVTGTKTITFAEDEGGGTKTVKYVVNAGSEKNLWVGKPVGMVTTVDVDTDCLPPNLIETSHDAEVCGQVTVTLRNRSPWIYPVSVSTDGTDPDASGPMYGPTVDNRTNGGVTGPQKDVTKSKTYTFAEDSGPQVLKYVVAAGTEKDLYVGKDVGKITTVNVDTDCIPPQPDPIVTSVPTDTVQCDLNRVETSTVTTTINFSLVANEWVQDAPIVSDPVITYRDATEAECPTAVDPIDPVDPVDPVADDNGDVKSGQANVGVLTKSASSAPRGGVLPDTGAPSAVLAALGALLLAAGSLLVRRRATQ